MCAVTDGEIPSVREISAFGYRFHPMAKTELLDLVLRQRASERQVCIASANLHGLFMFERNAVYRALHARPSTLVIVDGMPIVWLLSVLGHHVKRHHRTTWVDWFEDALERAAEEGRRVFILGHAPGVLAAGLRKARERWPALEIAGRDGFFDIDDASARADVVATINTFTPDILFVGMGMPKQETFAALCADQLRAPVIGLGGAAFAYFAGEQARPPRWMGRAGLEWAHRLAKDPRRLAARYFVEPILLVLFLSWRLARENRTKPQAVRASEDASPR